MADVKQHTVGSQDRKRINIGQDYDVRDWAKKFGVTPERLREAVLSVGTWVAAVQRELGKSKA